MKQLLEAGVHFGHQTSRWNPKMRPYIFGARNGIHIIDLQQTVNLFRSACDFIQQVAANGGNILFVGTKKQAQDPIQKEAERCQQMFVRTRWLGGTLTNFQTIKQSIERLKRMEEQLADEHNTAGLKKKERLMIQRDVNKLRVNLEGIREMKKLPDALFVIDPDREQIAVNEANRLAIPVVAVVDTNCDPDRIAYCIPGNDDAIRAVRLFCQAMADAVIAGRQECEERGRAIGSDSFGAEAATALRADQGASTGGIGAGLAADSDTDQVSRGNDLLSVLPE
jgi:small subunit ribosomal protein S2